MSESGNKNPQIAEAETQSARQGHPASGPDPQVSAFLAYLNALPKVPLESLTADQIRAQMTAMGELAEAPLGPIAVDRAVSLPGPAGEIPARMFDVRETRGPGPIVVFYHGGGFAIGDVALYAPLCAEVSRQLDVPVLSIDYRLAPEHRFPAAHEDAVAAARWVATNPQALGVRATGMILMGDSAGGNLALTTAIALRDRPAPLPVDLICAIYPVVHGRLDWPSQIQYAEGHLLTMEGICWFYDQYRADDTDPRFNALDADLSGLPPTMVVTAGLDPLRDQGLAFVARARDAGVAVTLHENPAMIHGFITLRRALPSAQAALDDFLAHMRPLLPGTQEGQV